MTDQNYCPVTRLSPSIPESANGTTFSSWELDILRRLSFFVLAMDMFVKTLTSREDPFFLPVRHRRQTYLVEYLFK